MLGLGCDNPDPSFRWIMIEFWHFDKSDSFLAPGIWRCCEEPERVWRHCWDKTIRYSDSSNTTTTTGSSSPHQRQSHGPFYPHLTISQVRKKYKKVFGICLARQNYLFSFVSPVCRQCHCRVILRGAAMTWDLQQQLSSSSHNLKEVQKTTEYLWP